MIRSVSPPHCFANFSAGVSYALRRLTWKQQPSRTSVLGFGLVGSVRAFCRVVYLQSKLTTLPLSVLPLRPFMYNRFCAPLFPPFFTSLCVFSLQNNPVCVFCYRRLLSLTHATLCCVSHSDICGLPVGAPRLWPRMNPPLRHILAIQ